MPEGVQGADVASSRPLEKHYRDMQDIEFTVQQGKLWMLQTRNGKRTAKAALRIAVDMANEGLITKESASSASIRRARPAAASDHRPEGQARCDRHRPAGFAGRGLGRDRVLRRRSREASRPMAQGHSGARRNQPGRHSRHACREGILTTRGGMTSHAAVVARGMGKPCVSGAGDVRIDYGAAR
jgi:pyruvate,orthophosphate dikinase